MVVQRGGARPGLNYRGVYGRIDRIRRHLFSHDKTAQTREPCKYLPPWIKFRLSTPEPCKYVYICPVDWVSTFHSFPLYMQLFFSLQRVGQIHMNLVDSRITARLSSSSSIKRTPMCPLPYPAALRARPYVTLLPQVAPSRSRGRACLSPRRRLRAWVLVSPPCEGVSVGHSTASPMAQRRK